MFSRFGLGKQEVLIKYLNKELSEYSLWDLGLIERQLSLAEDKREEASKHPKFTTGVDKKKAMPFPSPNPAFLELKSAIEEEIRKKQNGN